MNCYYLNSKEYGKVLIPGCIAVAVHNDIDYCTCRKETKPEKELFDKIKNHTEHWKSVNKYKCPYDYAGLKDIIKEWMVRNNM